MRADTEQWWEQAQADLRVAGALLATGDFFAVSFHAHEAAEKAIKALYIERRNRLPPRIHDLRLLGTEVGVPASIQSDLAIVFPAFGLSRYPDNTGVAPVHRVTESAARDHLEAARRVLRWIDGQL